MKPLRQWLQLLGALVVVGGILFWSIDRFYLEPRAARLDRIEDIEAALMRYGSILDERRVRQAQFRSYVDRTLGPDIETVDHRLRSRLNRLLEAADVREPVVSTQSAKPFASPASREYLGRSELYRELRTQLDFVAVPASVSGLASLEGVLEVVDRLSIEPWMKRIESVSLSPRGHAGLFTFTIRLVTIYVPGEMPNEHSTAPYEASRKKRFVTLVASNPFHVPDPPAPQPVAVEGNATPPPRTQFPYEAWKVTGIVDTGRTSEVWLLQTETLERRIMQIGDGLGETHLAAVEKDVALFESTNDRWTGLLGSTLERAERP